MADDEYLKDLPGYKFYRALRVAFPGATGLRTLFTEPGSPGDVPSANFKKLYDAFVAAVKDNNRGDLVGPSKSANTGLLYVIADFDKPAGNSSALDRLDALETQCLALREALNAAIAAQPELAFCEPLRDLENGVMAMTVRAMGGTLAAQNGRNLARCIAEVSLRHCSSLLYRIVGDPTQPFLYGSDDTPYNYLRNACGDLNFNGTVSDDDRAKLPLTTGLVDMSQVLVTLGENYKDAKDYTEVFSQLALLADVLAEEILRTTNDDLEKGGGPKNSIDPIALSSRFCQGSRGVLKLEPKRTGAFASSSNRAADLAAAAETAQELYDMLKGGGEIKELFDIKTMMAELDAEERAKEAKEEKKNKKKDKGKGKGKEKDTSSGKK